MGLGDQNKKRAVLVSRPVSMNLDLTLNCSFDLTGKGSVSRPIPAHEWGSE